MAALPNALGVVDTNRGDASVAEKGLGFLRNLSHVAVNQVRLCFAFEKDA